MENLIKMLESDGISSERILEYKISFRKAEDVAFNSGRSFERDGKSALVLGYKGGGSSSECDLFKQEQIDYFANENKEERENLERYSD